MSLSPLTRTCLLTDYQGCTTPAVWQQRFVDEVYQRWWPEPEADLHAEHLLLNMSGCYFAALPEIAPLQTFERLYTFLNYPVGVVASIIGLMVVDRIDAPLAFMKHCAHLLRPGGLLVLTLAYWDSEGEDLATGHEVRLRIYNRISWRRLAAESERYDLHLFGGCDWGYHGHALGDHTLASLVLTKGSRT